MSWNIDFPWSLNSSDTFPRRKFENWPPRSCRPGPILSISNVSFELHAKVAEEIYLENVKCTFMRNCRKCKWSVTLTLTLDRVKVTSTYTVHVGLHAGPTTWLYRNMAIWISSNIDIGRSLNSRDSFLDGNSKIGLRQAVVQVPYYGGQPSVFSSTPKWRSR